MTYEITKCYEQEYTATVEADSIDEAIEKMKEMDLCDYDECDVPYLTYCFIKDEEDNDKRCMYDIHNEIYDM